MKWVLIGHRGVGKTQFLKRLETYYKDQPGLEFFDLDQQIERKYQKPLTQLFPEVGEARFREIENEMFAAILQTSSAFIISLGAGFSSEKLVQARQLSGLPDLKVIWLRRKTDELGRIFLNRPRLNSKISPLEEFLERFPARQKSYQDSASEVYWMPEGLHAPHATEQKIWGKAGLSAGGVLTLLPWHLREFAFLRYECDYYEFRDDLLDLMTQPWQKIRHEHRLLSFRSPNSVAKTLSYLPEFALADWALELGPCPSQDISLISAHERGPAETLRQFLLRLEQAALPHQHLKAAPIIENYFEASELLNWQEQDCARRNVLPRSQQGQDGRWLWLRLYLKARQKINFWRDSEGSAADQPTLFEWLSSPKPARQFAALLGQPVFHSRTMVEQAEFFSALNCPVWPIPLIEDEFASAFEFLCGHGLIAAAVTSPLKREAFKLKAQQSVEAKELQATNTLWVSANGVFGHNTDLIGFEKLCAQIQLPLQNLKVAVWGGGGTLAVIQKVFPQAIEISVRSRQVRDSQRELPQRVDILIWAAGPRDPLPPEMEFELIIDLNYREDSRARELAVMQQKKYFSGEEMFLAQASAQRDFWTSLIATLPANPF